MSNINASSRAQQYEPGVIGKVAKWGVGGAVAGGVAGGVGGSFVPILGNGIGLIGGALIGGVAGIAKGMNSSDPNAIQNRPIKIMDLTGGESEAYISANQFKQIKEALAKGVKFDNLPENLAEQFNGDCPPAVKQ